MLQIILEAILEAIVGSLKIKTILKGLVIISALALPIVLAFLFAWIIN